MAPRPSPRGDPRISGFGVRVPDGAQFDSIGARHPSLKPLEVHSRRQGDHFERHWTRASRTTLPIRNAPAGGIDLPPKFFLVETCNLPHLANAVGKRKARYGACEIKSWHGHVPIVVQASATRRLMSILDKAFERANMLA